jgi:[acyl-carrier-protein] S-malonyltransferase
LGELGVDRILDLGPGHALADMARDALAGVRAYSTSDFHSIEGLREWIASA